jgi:hypothetical protein
MALFRYNKEGAEAVSIHLRSSLEAPISRSYMAPDCPCASVYWKIANLKKEIEIFIVGMNYALLRNAFHMPTEERWCHNIFSTHAK